MFRRFFKLLSKSKETTTHEETNTTIETEVESSYLPRLTSENIPDTYSTSKIVSRRSADMSAESELAEFLDGNLYAQLLNEGKFLSIERAKEKAQQLHGIDVIAKTKDSVAYIDEKAQLYYINKSIPTFAFELQFLKDGKVIEGWFLNDDLKTDYYLLIWPFASVTDVQSLKKEDFTKLDALMIKKTKLRTALASLGLDKYTLRDKAAEIRKGDLCGKIPTGIQGIYYYASSSSMYVEAPINIVISKSHLLSLADVHYEITPSGFTRF